MKINSMNIEDRIYNKLQTIVKETQASYYNNSFVLLESVKIEFDKKTRGNYLINIEAKECCAFNRDTYKLSDITCRELDINHFTTTVYTNSGEIRDQYPSEGFLFPCSMSFEEAIAFFEHSSFKCNSPYFSTHFDYSYVKLYKLQDKKLNPDNHLMYEFKDVRVNYTQYFYLDVVTKNIVGKVVNHTDKMETKVEYTFKEV